MASCFWTALRNRKNQVAALDAVAQTVVLNVLLDNQRDREAALLSQFLPREQLREDPIWNAHSRAYKRYFARVKAGTMTRTEFEAWSRMAAEQREAYLRQYNREDRPESKDKVVREFEERLKQV